MAQNQLKKQIRLIAIGGSSGSFDALSKILGKLKADFTIPIIMILHRNNADSGLAIVLGTKTNLIVKEAEEKEMILPGYLYLAPPDYHLLIEADKTLSLDVSEKVNYSRPSIDVTFESAAAVYKDELLCIILSGANADGTKGGLYAKDSGSTIIAQNPLEASVAYMPQHAINEISTDEVLSVEEIAKYLNML